MTPNLGGAMPTSSIAWKAKIFDTLNTKDRAKAKSFNSQYRRWQFPA